MLSKTQQGFSLVELLIAMVVAVTGIVGSVAIQATAKKNSFDAMQRAQATSLAHDIIERIRGNKEQLLSYAGTDYGKQEHTGVTLCHVTQGSNNAVDCSPEDLAAYDKFQWNDALKGADITKTVQTTNGAEAINVGGLIDPTACIFITQGLAADSVTQLTNAGSVEVVISWQGRFETKDANISNGNDCGGKSVDNQRRQIAVSAYIF
ncbi:type IV pilus modification protein PilV [Catenovulum sp. SM1970]|uniref:type IV pilus modification protein PilV n=1 Tax=Marinifaba aquimaris TaxID=2741323 RepID=UPI0015743750|nr:type IV pilus modification protein PilV [Marinifaba aquimaris]NTS76706.1 type IV pilus modification protein PilV [Marinifaba aquimaris]